MQRGGVNMANVNENIRDMRKLLGLTQEEVGKRIGVSKQTVQRYESGEISNIPYDKIISLSEALSCSPACIMGWEEYQKDHKTSHSAKEDAELIKKYHLLSERDKQVVMTMIDSMLNK